MDKAPMAARWLVFFALALAPGALLGCSGSDTPGPGQDTGLDGDDRPDTGDVSDPDVSDPDANDPDVADPDVSDPDVSDPDVSDPDTGVEPPPQDCTEETLDLVQCDGGVRIVICAEDDELNYEFEVVQECRGACVTRSGVPTCICVGNDDCDPGFECSAQGQCQQPIICEAGATRCAGDTIQICDGGFAWLTLESCNGTCDDGGGAAACVCVENDDCGAGELCEDGACVPEPECTGSDTVCGDGVITTCVDERIELVEDCPWQCGLVASVPTCLCRNSADCAAGGLWCNPDTSVCEPEPECFGNAVSCLEGSVVQCVAGTLIELEQCAGACDERNGGAVCICADEFDCEPEEFCDVDATCQPDVCVPEDNGCDGSVAQTCAPDGSALIEENCGALSCVEPGLCQCTNDDQCGPDAFCSAGSCVLNFCTPNETFCLGNTIQLCNGTGNGYSQVRNCLSGCTITAGGAECSCTSDANCRASEYCDTNAGICEPDVCFAGTRDCDGNTARVCTANGSGYALTPCGDLTCNAGRCECTSDAQCGSGQYCQATVCQAQVCVPGASFCTAAGVAQCNANGSGSSLIEACSEGCANGACTCTSNASCGSGDSCVDGSCACASGIRCGDSGACCPGGTICEEREFCVGGNCDVSAVCIPPCVGGERCGSFGEICCSGAAPICGATNQCEPDCGGEPACGGACCDAGDYCLFGECRQATLDCDSWIDCAYDEYCEPLIGQCLPNDFPVECRQPGDFGAFRPTTLWHWQGVTLAGRLYQNVVSVPITADIDRDGFPEVIVRAYPNNSSAIVVVIDGRDGTTRYANPRTANNRDGSVAVANIDADPYLEIVTILDKGIGMIDDIVNCPDPSVAGNCFLWTYVSGTLNRSLGGSAPNFADFNGDGIPEVYIGSVVLDAATGALIVDGGLASTAQGNSNGEYISAAADVNMDGSLELLTGDCAWKVNVAAGTLTQAWCNPTFANGFPSVADFDLDGFPEVVTVKNGKVYFLNGQTGATLHAFDLPNAGHGGAPNIADFDNDGRPEIGTAGRGCYTVFDLDCIGSTSLDQPGCKRPVFPPCTAESCPIEACTALPTGTGNGILWSVRTRDATSGTTGSSVFDFQGDGVAEVLYNDECRMLAMDGRNGHPFIAFPNPTKTSTGYPIVVDVDGDGRSELVFGASIDNSNNCSGVVESSPELFPECDPSLPNRPQYCFGNTFGVYAWSDPNDSWVRTRPIWNQHAYQITNIEDDGTVPTQELRSWEFFNMFRANQQGEVPLNSPDPAITSFTASLLQCPPTVNFRVQVVNNGTRGIPAGMPLTLYLLEGGTGTAIDTAQTTQDLFPGQVTLVTFSVSLDPEDFRVPLDFAVELNIDGDPVFDLDCDYGSNAAILEGVRCIVDDPIVSQ